MWSLLNQKASNITFFLLCFLLGAAEMKMHLSLMCLCALALTAVGHKGVQSQALTYAERGSDLGIQVFQQVVSTKPLENVVLSPHGVASILGMLLPGAHGETKKQILSGLRYKKNGKDPFLLVVLVSCAQWL